MEAMSFQTSDPPTVGSLYPQCEAITDKRWHLRCKHVARHGFHTCMKHMALEAGIVSRKAAAAAAAAERDALEAQYKAADHHVILCDGYCVPQDEEYAIKCTLDVEEIECLQFHTKAVLYGFRSYDVTKKKHVLYVAETPDDAKELARATQEGNWYRAALFPSEKMSDSDSE